MEALENMSNEQLRKMIEAMADVILEITDSQEAEKMLRLNGFKDEELVAIGFEVEA